jgi:MEDS: MEthanogen/methylotroph, DcmR Sensory domain
MGDRGAGYPGRSDRELAEWQLHEALLNVAFDAAVPFWLLCPCDLEALAAEVIDDAQRTHPYLVKGEERSGRHRRRMRPACPSRPAGWAG